MFYLGKNQLALQINLVFFRWQLSKGQIFMYCTAKRILERLGTQTSSSFAKLCCIPEFKDNFFLLLRGFGFLSRNYWS